MRKNTNNTRKDYHSIPQIVEISRLLGVSFMIPFNVARVPDAGKPFIEKHSGFDYGFSAWPASVISDLKSDDF